MATSLSLAQAIVADLTPFAHYKYENNKREFQIQFFNNGFVFKVFAYEHCIKCYEYLGPVEDLGKLWAKRQIWCIACKKDLDAIYNKYDQPSEASKLLTEQVGMIIWREPMP